MAFNAQQRVIRSVGYYHNLTTRPSSQYRQDMTVLMNQTGRHVDGTKRLLRPNTSPHHPALEEKRQGLQDTPTTYAGTWTIEPARPDQSTDQGDVLQHETTTIKPGVTSITKFGPRTEHG